LPFNSKRAPLIEEDSFSANPVAMTRCIAVAIGCFWTLDTLKRHKYSVNAQV
jgi:hypothetical protein